MLTSLSQMFRKSGGDSPTELALHEDLECGKEPSVTQNPIATGYPSSPSRVYLPQAQSIHASMFSQTSSPSHEYSSHILHNSQDGSTARATLTPSGPSRVLGYLPRILYTNSLPSVGRTRLVMPSEPSQMATDRDIVVSRGPLYCSTLMSSPVSEESPSPSSPFDPGKHGQALRRLETHGSLKTIAPTQEEGEAINRTSIPWSEIGRELFEEDLSAGSRGSLPWQPEFRASVDPYATGDQQSGADLSTLPRYCCPNPVFQPVVLGQGDSSEVVNVPDAPKVESGQMLRETLPSFIFPLPNTEAENSNQLPQQALHGAPASLRYHQAPYFTSLPRVLIASDAPPDFPSMTGRSEGMFENNTTGSIVRSSCSQGSEQLEDTPACEAEEGKDLQRPIGNPIEMREHPVHTFTPSQISEQTDEYLWSPAPSDDGQGFSSATHTPISRRVPSNTLRTSPISGLTLDSNGILQPSRSYGNEHIHSRSSLISISRVIDSPLPYIDVLIPAGNINLDSQSDFFSSSRHASTKGSRDSSSILFRYSGVVTDGASSRPMSEIELKEEVLHSLGEQRKAGMSMPSSRNSRSLADGHPNNGQIPGEHEPNSRLEAFQLDRVQNPSPADGPGSSQTSSSLDIDPYGGGPSDRKASLENHGLPLSRGRCPTPPLLFGKNAIREPVKLNTSSRPNPGNTIGRFDQEARAIRPTETSGLPITLGSFGEQDWETVSAENEADTHSFDGIAYEPRTSSSLADNSDSGNLSLSKETPYQIHGVKARPVMQHPAHPRYNHSFVLLKNSQTGDAFQVPQYEYASGRCLPRNNASTQIMSRVRADSTYQHPSPLRTEHNHPFTSSPPTVHFADPSAVSMEDSYVMMQQNRLISESSSSGLSERVQEVERKQPRNPLYKTAPDLYCIRDLMVDQNRGLMTCKEQSHQSSTWLSTVSENESSEPLLRGSRSTFTKMMVWDGNGRINTTPERSGNREIGSSLADASSPGANLSSSPVPLVNSPTQFSKKPPSLENICQEQAIRHDLDYEINHQLGDFYKPFARSLNREDSAASITKSKHRSRSHSASGPQLRLRHPPLRRRRSSSETYSRLMDSPSAQKASALYASSSDSHAQQLTNSGILLRNPFVHSDDDDPRPHTDQHNAIGRRGRPQAKSDDTSTADSPTPSPTESQPFVRDGVVHTDVPSPIFHHPVYGHDRAGDRARPVPARPRPRPADPRGHPLFQRPVARAESPHLHRIPHPPTLELMERQVLLSRLVLMLSMVIPPVALIYGHGYMDGIMRFHTEGQIDGFCTTEKNIALFWGYGSGAICILAIVIAMIIVSTSA